jgi:hypothetical protein
LDITTRRFLASEFIGKLINMLGYLLEMLDEVVYITLVVSIFISILHHSCLGAYVTADVEISEGNLF